MSVGDKGVDVGGCASVCAGDELIDDEGSVVGVVLCVTDAAKVASYISEAGISTVMQCTLLNPSGNRNGSGSGISSSISGPTIPSNEDSKSVWEWRLGGGSDGEATSTCLVLLKASYVVSDAPSTSTSNNDLSITTPSSSPSSSPSPTSLFIRSHHHPSAPLTSVTSWTSTDDDSRLAASPRPLRIVPVSFATYDTAYSPAPPVEKVMPPGEIMSLCRFLCMSM